MNRFYKKLHGWSSLVCHWGQFRSRLGQLLEIRHRDVICTHCTVNQNWIHSGVCHHMRHRTGNLKAYLLQWN